MVCFNHNWRIAHCALAEFLSQLRLSAMTTCISWSLLKTRFSEFTSWPIFRIKHTLIISGFHCHLSNFNVGFVSLYFSHCLCRRCIFFSLSFLKLDLAYPKICNKHPRDYITPHILIVSPTNWKRNQSFSSHQYLVADFLRDHILTLPRYSIKWHLRSLTIYVIWKILVWTFLWRE